MAVPLAQRVGIDASAAQIADALAATWQDIDTALATIVGSKGVAALYRRSLHLTAASHPWLASAQEGAATTLDLAALMSVVAKQSSADAALGSSALLQTFHELLSSLLGSSLTEQLLRPVWSDSSSGPSAQDIKR